MSELSQVDRLTAIINRLEKRLARIEEGDQASVYDMPTGLTEGDLFIVDSTGSIVRLEEASCCAYKAAAKSIVTATWTLLDLDTELWDDSGDSTAMHDVSTNNSRIYVRNDGKYLITSRMRFGINATGLRITMIRSNAGGSSVGGTKLIEDAKIALTGRATTLQTSFVVDLNDGDYIESFIQQTSGGNLNLLANVPDSPFITVSRLSL